MVFKISREKNWGTEKLFILKVGRRQNKFENLCSILMRPDGAREVLVHIK